MEMMKIIRKIAAYGLMIVSATWFLYGSIVIATSMYIKTDLDIKVYYLENIFRPFMYVVLSLSLLFVSQFALIGKRSDNEKYLSSLFLMVFFGVGLSVSVFALVKGLMAIPQNATSKDPAYLLLAIIPAIVIFLGEVLYGLLGFVSSKRKEKEEAIKAESKKKEDDRVNLTKAD